MRRDLVRAFQVDVATSAEGGELRLQGLRSALTVVESIWRRFDANEHLEGAVNDARELHKRLQKFVEHLNKVGVSLSKAVDAYNASVSSFDSRLIPQARKIEAADLAPGQVVLELKAVTDSVNPIGTSAAVSTPSQLPSVSEPGTPKRPIR